MESGVSIHKYDTKSGAIVDMVIKVNNISRRIDSLRMLPKTKSLPH